MAIKLMDTIETAGDFPVINAPSVGLPNGERLDDLFDGNGRVRESHLPEMDTSDPRVDVLLENVNAMFDENGRIKEAYLPEMSGGTGDCACPDDLVSPGTTVLLAEQEIAEFALNADLGVFCRSIAPAPYALTAGETYTVSWDTATVARTAFAFSAADGAACVGIGNPMAAGGEANEDTFVIVYDMTNQYLHYMSLEQAETHRVGVSQSAVKVNEKYLPEDWVRSFVEQYIDEALGGVY